MGNLSKICLISLTILLLSGCKEDSFYDYEYEDSVIVDALNANFTAYYLYGSQPDS